jgi:hypothetical protein
VHATIPGNFEIVPSPIKTNKSAPLSTPTPRRFLKTLVPLPTAIPRHLLEPPVLHLLRQVTPYPTQPRQEIS